MLLQNVSKKIGRVHFSSINEATAENLIPFIQDNVTQESTVITDGWKGYAPLRKTKDFEHQVKIMAGSGNKAHELLPHVHLVDSLVKRWGGYTSRQSFTKVFTTYYLDEFAFRFNRKLSTYQGKLFYRLIQQPIEIGPVAKSKIVENLT